MLRSLGCALAGVSLCLSALGQNGQSLTTPRLVYATYSGPARTSYIQGSAVDSQSYIYLVGTDIDPGPYPSCQFLRKLNQSGTAAVWSVCLPVQQVEAVALGASGNIYVASETPMPSAAMTTVMKLSPDAQHTFYSTQIGGVCGD